MNQSTALNVIPIRPMGAQAATPIEHYKPKRLSGIGRALRALVFAVAAFAVVEALLLLKAVDWSALASVPWKP